MSFLWEDSTGARAVKFLREHEQGFVIDSVPFATALGVKPGALHQLLDNALKLRFVKKVYGRGPCVGWKLGAAGDSVTIERRKTREPLTLTELERRRSRDRKRRCQQREPSQRAAWGSNREPGWRGDRVADAVLGMPWWLAGANRQVGQAAARPIGEPCSRPVSYLARWHVLYRDERGQVHGEVQVQAIHADLGVIDAWCEVRGGMDRFALSGLARVVDVKSGARVDLQTWLARIARTSVAAPDSCSPGAGAGPRGRPRGTEAYLKAISA